MLILGEILGYLIIGLIVSIAAYIFQAVEDEFSLALMFVAWPLTLVAMVVMVVGYGIGYILKWIGNKIKRIKK